MEKVLILLSTYNGERYLKELITSLFSQKDVDIHLMIRDDGSSDGTIDYIKTVNDNRVNYYIGENKRAVGSFLDLIKKASLDYDYYAFCDQDDVWLEDKLILAVNQLNHLDSSKPALYYSGQVVTDSHLNVLYSHHLDTKRSIKANCIFNQMAGCTAVFNRALLNELKKHDPEKIYSHDVWCYRVCAALKGNIIVESEGRILYRQHEKNVVGLQKGLKGKLKNVKDYIFKYNASSYACEILKGYNSNLDQDWQLFLQNLTNSNTSFKCRVQLLKDSEIKFHSPALRVLFICKVILRKM